MKPEQRPVGPLRVELVARSDIKRFLNAAVQLAKVMEVELEAVFLQDPEILDAAALPMVQEVCLWTAREQYTSTTMLAKSMRIQARQTRTLLADIAEREAVPCSFVTVQNGLSGPGASTLEPGICWVGGKGLSTNFYGCPVCVIDSGDKAGQACLPQAAECSAKTNRPLRVYKLGGGNKRDQQPDIDALYAWLQSARDMACYILFMPKSTYTKYRSDYVLKHVPFPVLLV